jgi:hypothetical protein
MAASGHPPLLAPSHRPCGHRGPDTALAPAQAPARSPVACVLSGAARWAGSCRYRHRWYTRSSCMVFVSHGIYSPCYDKGMATRRSRRGQPAEFEADEEIARTFRQNVAEARQTIDDVLPAESKQKEEALEAVSELVEGVAGGDEAVLQESIETLDQFTASVLIADKDDGADEDEVQEAIDTLSESGANVSLSAALMTDSDEESDDGSDSSVDDWASAAQFQEGEIH